VIDDLNQMPIEMIDEARRLHGAQRYVFLSRRVTRENGPFLDAFIKDVVEGNADATSWGRSCIVVPKLSLSELLVCSVAEILEPLEGPGEDGWFTAWFDTPGQSFSHFNGAPAVPRPDAKYRWCPTGRATTLVMGHVQLLPVARIQPAVRRWMAHRIVSGDTFQDYQIPTNLDAIAHELGIEAGSVSQDAIKATQAFAEEASMKGDENEASGFHDLDLLYE